MSRLTILLIALFLSAGAVASSSAQGSCGDWLAHSGDTAKAVDGPQTDVSAEKTKQGAEKSPVRQPRPRSCRGLHCEQAPLTPAPLPASPVNDQRLPDLAYLVVVSPANEFEITHGGAESKLGLPAGNQLTIERPPKV